MLVMTLQVRDEEDILKTNLDFHLDMGVDHIIVTDNLSVDGTPDIIADYARMSCVTSLYDNRDDYSQAESVTRMARLACQELNAQWIINNDADEFWFPTRADSLKKQFSRLIGRNVVVAQRSDFICLEEGENPFWQRLIYRKAVSLNSQGKKLPPKVAHRAIPNIEVAPGSHRVEGFRWQRAARSGVEILHFPMRCRDRYIEKVRVHGLAFANKNGPAKGGGAIREQYRELLETGHVSHLESNTFTADQVKTALNAGTLVRDTRLRDAMLRITGVAGT